MNRVCTKCNKEKDVKDFRVKNKEKGTFSCWCKECFCLYEKEKWAGSKERRASNYKKNCERRARNRKFLYEYLLTHPCVKCGQEDPIVLTFDHRNADEKDFSIANAVRLTYSLSKIENEIKKCNVLCANCHQRRTAEQFGWWKHFQ